MDCKTRFDALAVKSSVARKTVGAKSFLLHIIEVEVNFNLGSISLPVKRTPVPYRHYLLASLRAGLSAIAMVATATVIAACSNSQAEARLRRPKSMPPRS